MKYTILLFIFLCASYSFSQEYELRIFDFNYYANRSGGKCGTNEMWLDIHLKNNKKER